MLLCFILYSSINSIIYLLYILYFLFILLNLFFIFSCILYSVIYSLLFYLFSLYLFILLFNIINMFFIKVEKEESESRISTPLKKNGKGKKFRWKFIKWSLMGDWELLEILRKCVSASFESKLQFLQQLTSNMSIKICDLFLLTFNNFFSAKWTLHWNLIFKCYFLLFNYTVIHR